MNLRDVVLRNGNRLCLFFSVAQNIASTDEELFLNERARATQLCPGDNSGGRLSSRKHASIDPPTRCAMFVRMRPLRELD